jgi:hypothetical protein
MADNPKLKAARIRAENKIYELLDDLEGCKDGYNSNVYKNYFASLSDAEFKKFMDRLANEEWFNLYFEIKMTDKKKAPNMNRIKKVLDKYKIPMCEYVVQPYKNLDVENPPISTNPVPVFYGLVRPLQQLLSKKEAYSSDRDHVNLLTNQVTGSSKSSTFSNMQSIALTTSNQFDTLKELLGPRSDDEVSKKKMLDQIADTGDFDINSIPVRTKDKQSIETVRVMLVGAGLRVSFGKDKLSYLLPTD